MRSLRDWTFYPITTRELTVLRTADVTPGMRRVTLGGEALAAHTAASGHPVQAFRSEGFDDEFKLLLRHPEEPVALVPTQLAGVLDWPRDPHLVVRTYTARRWDPAAGELDVDLVLHGEGPAVRWAEEVRPGDRVQIAGPKMSGTHPRDADWSLIAGDETALPAIGRWLEEFPAGARAQVFIEVGERRHRQDLRVPEGVEVTWLVREDAPAGSTSLLQDALQAAPWWPGTVFAWVAGEALSLAPIRRWLRREKGLPPEQVEVTGYWRRPAVPDPEPAEDPGTAERPDPPASAVEAPGAAVDAEPRDPLHAADLVGPLALRVAATLGLGAALVGEGKDLTALAAETGADATGLRHLLEYLAATGWARAEGGGGQERWAWTAQGALLGEEHVEERLRLDGPSGLRELGVLGLLPAVRRGRGEEPGVLSAVLGAPVSASSPDRIRERLDHEAEEASYLAGPLAELTALPGIGALAGLPGLRVSGRGAEQVVRALRARHPELPLRLLADAPEAAVLRERLQGSGVRIEPDGLLDPPPSDAAAHLLVDVLDRYPDDAARALLRAARGAVGGGRVVLVDEALEAGLRDEHEAEADLIGFARGEGGVRSREDRDALLRQAGLEEIGATTVGWGFDVRVLR